MSLCSVDCNKCVNNVEKILSKGAEPTRHCLKRIVTFPHAKIFCTGFVERKGDDEVAAKTKHTKPLPKDKPEPKVTDHIHLFQYVNKKVDDRQMWYIYLPAC